MILFMLFVGEMLPLSMMMFVLKFLTQGSVSRKKDVKLVPEFGAIYPFAANICTVEYQLTTGRQGILSQSAHRSHLTESSKYLVQFQTPSR
jgi:hypothetical protein